MRRSLLATMTVLGALICLVGGTGLFAALTDTATTGTNTVTSGDLPTSIDIKLATATSLMNVTECGTFVDDLATPLFTQTDLRPNNAGQGLFCLTNVGARTATHVGVVSIDLVDTDQACTGDEADSGDTTCGASSDGELSDVLSVVFYTVDCGSGDDVDATAEVSLTDTVSTAIPLPAIPAGATLCIRSQLSYREPADPAAAQIAQSDTATWRFRFTAGT